MGYKGFAKIAQAADRRLKERDHVLKLYEKFSKGDTVQWKTMHNTKEQGVILSIFEKDELTPVAHLVSKTRKPVIPLAQLSLIKKGTTGNNTKKVKKMETKETQKPENTAPTKQFLLVGDGWFKQHPAKILGEAYETTNRFNKKVTKIRGKLTDALQGIDVPAVAIPTHHVEALASHVKQPLEQFINEAIHRENVATVIKATQKNQAEKKLKQLDGEKESTDLTARLSFKDIMQQYNKGITEDEIKAWVWYKRKINGYNDETVILNKKTVGPTM